jgi:hypothetical protein
VREEDVMKKSVLHLKGFFLLGLVFLFALGLVGTFLAGEACAQIRPAMVRSVDEPALQPFRAAREIYLDMINEQVLVTTVPAGKRLVIEHISWYVGAQTGHELVFAGLRNPQYGTYYMYLQINPPHAAATTGYTIQDGSQSVKVYFEAGEEVWLSASRGTAGPIDLNIVIQGHFITP